MEGKTTGKERSESMGEARLEQIGTIDDRRLSSGGTFTGWVLVGVLLWVWDWEEKTPPPGHERSPGR